MENLEIYNKYREVPKEAQKEITAGRIKGFTDINSMWRIKCLTEQFGPCGIGWYIEVIDERAESYNDQTAVFVDINLYVKSEGEWSKPIYGTGGSMFVTQESRGVHVSDECFKMAVTDAISVACKMLGIGADIYWAEDRTKYGADKNTVDNKATPVSGNDIPNQAARTIKELGGSYLSSLKTEMDNKFVTEDKILSRYKVSRLEDLTFSQYQDAMKGLEKTKPPINPPEIPDDIDDPELPWNTPAEKSRKRSKKAEAAEAYGNLMDAVDNGKFS